MVPDGSLEDMKNGIKNKLRIIEDTDVKLVQLRDGRHVDLEDGTAIPGFVTNLCNLTNL